MSQRRRNENSVTKAIVTAADRYCSGLGLEWPVYSELANSNQGAAYNQLCGDLLMALGDYQVGLFEVKELQDGVLVEFKEEQHKDCLAYESLGVPIEYAYGPAGLQSQMKRADATSPAKVLDQIKRSKPSRLVGKKPKTHLHKSLRTWFAQAVSRGGGAAGKPDEARLTTWEALGRIDGTMRDAAENFRNGALILLYSANATSIKGLTPNELDDFVKHVDGASLKPEAQKRLEGLLGQSKKVTDALKQINPPPDGDDVDDEIKVSEPQSKTTQRRKMKN